MDKQFSALSDSTRREIMRLVAGTRMSVGEITEHFDMSSPAISQHLKVLREAGLVEMEREGQKRQYRANKQALALLMGQMDEFWSVGLLDLKRKAEGRDKS